MGSQSKKTKNVKRNIAGKIQKAMAAVTIICLGILGMVSLVCIAMCSRTVVENDLKETAELAATLIQRDVVAMKNTTYEIGCNPVLAGTEISNEDKIAILQQKVEQYNYTGCGLTMADNIDIVSGWDCTTQDTVTNALTGKVYFSEPKIHPGSPFTSYFSAPLWKDGIPNSEIVGTVIFMSNDHFIQDMIKDISISETCNVFILDQHGNVIGDAAQDILTEIINYENLAAEDSSYKALARVSAKMIEGERGFETISLVSGPSYIAYAPIEGTDGWSVAITVSQSDYAGALFFSIAGIVVVGVGAILATIKISKKIAKQIEQPIQACAESIKVLSTGDLRTEINIDDSLEEAEILTGASEGLRRSLSMLIADMDFVLAELAHGNFTVQSRNKESYIGDFTSLLTSLEELKVKLSGTLQRIQESAGQVMHGSGQMAISAQDLASGAVNQTEAVESLRHTIINIADGVSLNAQQSRMALEKVDEVKEATLSSNEEMVNMTEAMERISATSTEIANIVAEIEDIASQTNLLSLNASIEAARAGEAGRGFSVVAEQIRKLAESSSQSALHTKELIDAAVAEVEVGNQITARTAQALGKVADALEEVREGAMTSTKLSEEQAEAMRGIEKEINQITDVVQNNSAAAQESSAICEELSAQAMALNGLVEEFSI